MIQKLDPDLYNNPTALEELFKHIDRDGNGLIDYLEFVEAVKERYFDWYFKYTVCVSTGWLSLELSCSVGCDGVAFGRWELQLTRVSLAPNQLQTKARAGQLNFAQKGASCYMHLLLPWFGSVFWSGKKLRGRPPIAEENETRLASDQGVVHSQPTTWSLPVLNRSENEYYRRQTCCERSLFLVARSYDHWNQPWPQTARHCQF